MAFRPNTIKQLRKLKIEKPSGCEFNYQSINTYLLAIALQRVTGKKLSASLIEDAIVIAQGEISPISDARGTAEYKRLLLRQLFLAHFKIEEHVFKQVLQV